MDMRPVELQLGVIAQAAGSARLHLGATDVIVGVKVEVGPPAPSAPDQGRLQVSVEFSPCASPEYQGKSGETSGETIAAAIEASLRPSGGSKGTKPGPGPGSAKGAGAASSTSTSSVASGLDLRQLCILAGKTVWWLSVDALVLNDDGNVLTAISAATLAALRDTRVPKVEVVTDGGEEEIELDDSPGAAWRLDVGAVPLVLSVSQVGSRCVVDLTAAEERCCSSAAHVAVNAKGKVCGVSTEGRGGAEAATLLMMLETAQKLGPQLLKGVNAFLDAR